MKNLGYASCDSYTMVASPAKEIYKAPVSPGGSARFYQPELDILRFGAFCLVFLNHGIAVRPDSPHWLTALREAGALGVPVFFALSSYLITEMLQREQQATGTIHLKEFYLRRILRIWPLYFAALLVGYTVINLTHISTISLGALVANICLVGNIHAIFHGPLPFGLSALWTIGVEEQFYLVWPWLIKFGGRRMILGSSIALWIISQITLLILGHRYAPFSIVVWVNTLTHVQFFGIGAGISAFLLGSLPVMGNIRRLFIIGSGLALFYAASFYFFTGSSTDNTTIRQTYCGYLLASLGTLMILCGTLGAKIPSYASTFISLGKISYGLYIYHFPIIVFAMWVAGSVLHMRHLQTLAVFVLGMGLTILTAKVSYRYFETPFLKLKKRYEVVRSREI